MADFIECPLCSGIAGHVSWLRAYLCGECGQIFTEQLIKDDDSAAETPGPELA